MTMKHHRLDITERKANMRYFAAYEKNADDILIICPFCGERAYRWSDKYICKFGHEYRVPAGIFIRYGDWSQIKGLIANSRAAD